MTQKEIVTALRICSSPKTTCNGCPLDGSDDGLIVGTACFNFVPARAADLIENQQREIEALRQANEGLRFNLAAEEGGEICRAALETFGEEAQITMVFEEMAELQDVLCKFLRGRVDEDTRTHIAEEIADVEIMLRQMVILYGCAESVETFRRYKLERLAERIKEAKQ